MIRITLNNSKSAVSTRINKQQFERNASLIFKTVVENQIKEAKKINSKENSKNCNNPI
jgi:hypothetical protein